jgi:hypothetical protein
MLSSTPAPSPLQKYLQSLGRRVEEHRTTLRDTEAWMKHRQLPPDLRKKVRQFDRFKWSAMHGVDEERLLRQLPEDLTRDIKRHLCQGLVKKVGGLVGVLGFWGFGGFGFWGIGVWGSH